MLKKEASAIVGGLSTPGKMPCYSINLPATECNVGSILAQQPGTTCHGCYALKGRYRFKKTKRAMARRLGALLRPEWVQARPTLITGQKYFRWHDSGDLQSVNHLKKIYEVCINTPKTMHWLPTQERKYLPLQGSSYPDNLTIRLSNAKNNTKPGNAWTHWSTVVDSGGDCPASKQGNVCGSCRRCWSRDVKHVTYPKH